MLSTPYSIGYVEYAYWARNRGRFDEVGGVALIRNDNDGRFYMPSPESVAEGALSGFERYVERHGAAPGPDEDWNVVSVELANPPRGYPIVSFVYVFLWRDYEAEGYADAATKAAIIREFFRWVLTEGQRRLVEGYVPLPEQLTRVGLGALELVRP